MSRARVGRLVVVLCGLALGVWYVWRTPVDAARASLIVSAIICAVTVVYALFTYEILLQNQAMAKAATDSTTLMERSLRFSYAPNLLFSTLNVKDPKFLSRKDLSPIDNQDYQMALKEYAGGGKEKEFVFAIAQNVGRGAATNLEIMAEYKISDTTNPIKNYTVNKKGSVQILDSGKAVALCIWVSKLPTSDDEAQLVSAKMTMSDVYRDVLKEPRQETSINSDNHHFESEAGCLVHIL